MPPPTNDNPRRKNGFQTPFTGAQLSTWVALPTLIAEFLIVVAPLLPLAAAIPCTIVFGLTAALAAYYAFMAQYVDPMDDHLCKHVERQKNGEEAPNNGFGGCLGSPGDDVEPMKYCWICETQVAEHAMHCKFCNKCVGNFDHHCLWLNNCVGKANYHYFLYTMWFIAAMLIVHSVIQIALIIDIFVGGSTKDRADEWFDTGAATAVAGICIGFVVFDAVALSLILQLLHFHMLLQKEGLTTYKYIVRETQRKRERSNNEQARKNQRMVAMGKANDEGKTILALRLRYGETCQLCDPLPPLQVEEEKKDEEHEKDEENVDNEQPTQQETNGMNAPVYKPLNGQDNEADNENGQDSVNGNATNGSQEVVFVKT